MEIRVDADFVLASLFHSRDSVTWGDLQKYTKRIYSCLSGRNVYVDVCCNSLAAAVQGSPDVFSFDGDDGFSGDRGSGFFKEGFILKSLGRGMDEETKRKVFDLARLD